MERFIGTTVTEEAFRDLLGRFKQRSNFQIHNAIPAPILHADVSNLSPPFDSKFPLRIYRAKPLLTPSAVSHESLLGVDKLTIPLEVTKAWENELRTKVKYAKKAKIWAEEQPYTFTAGKVSRSNSMDPVFAPNSYLDVVNHLKNQPIPDFYGSYNWLLTGGCTTHNNVGNEIILFSPTGECQDELNISHLKMQQSNCCPAASQPSVNVPLSKDQRIFQTVARSSSNHGLAIVRQLRSCSVIPLEYDTENSLLSAHCSLEIQDAKSIFTSVDLCPKQQNMCATLNADFTLKVWDLNTSTCSIRGHIPPSYQNLDRWGFVKFKGSGNEILICNRKDVLLKDLRAPLKDSIQNFSISKLANSCDDVSYLVPSFHSHFAYVATSHFLFNLDFRAGWVQRWTHFLQLPPVYGGVQHCLDVSKELILLSSYLPSDCTAIFNSYEGEKPQSFTFPACLPSVGDSLLWVQSQGECLGPSLSKRTKMNTAGLTLLRCESSGSLASVTTTSLGDTFSQLFTSESPNSNCIRAFSSEEQDRLDLAVWRAWEADHSRISSENVSALRCPTTSRQKLFKCVTAPVPDPADKRIIKVFQKSFPLKRLRNQTNLTRPGWTHTMNELKTFKDLLAGLLLGPWVAQQPTQPGGNEESFEKSEETSTSRNFLFEASSLPSPIASDCEFESASVLEMSLSRCSSSNVKGPSKKRKRDSEGF